MIKLTQCFFVIAILHVATSCSSIIVQESTYPYKKLDCRSINMDSKKNVYHLSIAEGELELEYLLLFHVNHAQSRLVLMTPQSIPLYSLTCSDSTLSSDHYLTDLQAPGQEMLLGYILATSHYGMNNAEVLQDNWRWVNLDSIGYKIYSDNEQSWQILGNLKSGDPVEILIADSNNIVRHVTIRGLISETEKEEL